MDGLHAVRDVLRRSSLPVSEVREQMKFSDLNKINVSAKIEKKNNLSYLSWAWAVEQLLLNDSTATWEYKPHQMWGETVMVFCTVKAFGIERTAQLPVMDHRNKAISNPDAFAVNTAMQRCLAKAIALHGIGLYIYAGEDIPDEGQSKEGHQKLVEEHVAKIKKSKSIDDLKIVFADAYKQLKHDVDAIKSIDEAKETKKKKLTEVNESDKI